MLGLLWKELRENLYKVLTALAVCVMVHALRQIGDFNAAFSREVSVWILAVGGLSAGALAMDAIAGERSRGTMDFLLARPVTPLRILSAKFAVGMAGLLIVVAAFWAMVYATPFEHGHWGPYATWIVQDVAYANMVLTWFIPLTIAYSLVFFASAATENPAEAGAGGVLLAAGGVFFLYLLSQFVPLLTVWSLHNDLLGIPFDNHGSIVRRANSGWIQTKRLATATVIAALALAGAQCLITRLREYTISRRALFIGGFALLLAIMTIPRLLPEWVEKTPPVGRLDLPGKARALVMTGDHAYVLLTDGLLVADAAKPEAPTQAGAARAPGWTLNYLVVADGYAYATGKHGAAPDDSSGIITFDVRDPSKPVLASAFSLGALGDIGYSTDMVLLDDALLVGTVGENMATLRTLARGEDGELNQVDALDVERYGSVETRGSGDAPVLVHWDEGLPPPTRHSFRIELDGSRAYLGLRSGLAMIDVSDPGDLREAWRLPMEERTEELTNWRRKLGLWGHTVHVERWWPHEIAIIDVHDPLRPRQTGSLSQLGPRRDVTFWGDYLYHYRGDSIEFFPAVRPTERPVAILQSGEAGGGLLGKAGGPGSPVFAEGHAYALTSSRLLVFELPSDLLE